MLLQVENSRRWQHLLRNPRVGSATCPSNAGHLVPGIKTEEADLTLIVDTSSSHLEVLVCEPPLPALEPLSSNQRLPHWVPPRKHKKFSAWIQASRRRIFAGEDRRT